MEDIYTNIQYAVKISWKHSLYEEYCMLNVVQEIVSLLEYLSTTVNVNLRKIRLNVMVVFIIRQANSNLLFWTCKYFN